jgi:hypothetical protein
MRHSIGSCDFHRNGLRHGSADGNHRRVLGRNLCVAGKRIADAPGVFDAIDQHRPAAVDLEIEIASVFLGWMNSSTQLSLQTIS